MDCREAERRLNEYIDSEISKDKREAFIKHINECNDCKERYEEFLKYNSVLEYMFLEEEVSDMNFKDNIMNTILQEKLPKKQWYRRFSRGIAAACIALVCVTGIFIPWNGKSFAASIEDWVKSLSFKSKGVQYEVNSKVAEDFMSKINDDFHNMDSKREIYKTLEDAKKNIPVPVITPGYLPEGFTLGSIYYDTSYYPRDKTQCGLGSVQFKYWGKSMKVENKINGEVFTHNTCDSIGIHFSFNEEPAYKYYSITRGKNDIKFKKVKILDGYGVLSLSSTNTTNMRDLDIRLPKRLISITLINNYKLDPKFEKIAEEELLKMAESIVKQIK